MPEYSEGLVLAERFEIIGVLGRGGMATVYLARDQVRGERVALKVLHDHLAQDPAMRDRLRREVVAAARLRHPGALVAHELHDLAGTWALSLPFHPGQTLAEEIAQQGPMDPDAVRRLGVRLAEVLAEAHGAGLLHRDLTPSNVMIGARGEPMLTDFGLARLRDGGSTRGTGMLGTPGYAAPEVYDGVRADPRSDLYALGAVLYLAATGKAAFEADSAMRALHRQLNGDYTPLDDVRDDLPPDLVATIHALLCEDPARRPQGARDVAEALQLRHAAEAAPSPAAQPTQARTQAQDQTGRVRIPAPRIDMMRVELPAGEWTVIAKPPKKDDKRHERRAKHAWRQARRRSRRRMGKQEWREGWQADPGRMISEVVGIGGDFLGEIIEGDGTAPERVLADAVAGEVGLPDGALRTTATAKERRFRLVQGVERSAADRLAVQAADAGYTTELVPADRKQPFQLGPAAGPLFPAAIMVGLAFFLGFPLAYLFLALAAAFTITAMAKAVDGLTGRDLSALPLAYPNQLAPLLADDFEPSATLMSAPVQAPESTPVAPPQPLGRGAQVLGRVAAALGALDAAVESHRTELPPIAVSELDETITELGRRSRDLAGELDELEAELAQLDELDPASQLAALQGRLARLDTLARAGEPVEPSQRARLEAEIAAISETSATIQALESRITAVMSRLLDIGGTASRVRRQLLEEPEPAKSVEKLGEQLKRQAAAAARARRELAGG